MKIRIPAQAMRRLRPLIIESQKLGLPFYLVGGCVRDWILGTQTKDLDLVTESDPAALAQLCRRKWGGRLESFDQFGTLRLHDKSGFRMDFVRARSETYSKPAALPEVRPGLLEEDLQRRDFTVNAMAALPEIDGHAQLIDPFDGRQDLKRKVLRILHDASFEDDPTRLFRAARFACRFGFRLDPATERRRKQALAGGFVSRLSRERLRMELLRILEEKHPISVLRRLKTWGVVSHLHPQLKWPAHLERGNGAMERLGMISLHMGNSGMEFVRSLNLERASSQALMEAFEAYHQKSSPRSPLSPLAKRVIEASAAFSGARMKLGKAALRPVLITGQDLKALGMSSGPEFKVWLDKAAKAQWKGEFSTRAQALRWLRVRLKSNL